MTVKRPWGESFPSFCCCNKYACTSFCFVSAPCFVSEQLKKYFGRLLFVFIFTKDVMRERKGEKEGVGVGVGAGAAAAG